jgi:hypothetical protein
MERPWGEYMVQQFFNKYEMRFPAIDNLSSEAGGIRYALSTLHAEDAAEGAGQFLKFLVLETSLRQKVDFFGAPEEGATPKWDVAKVRQGLNAQFLLSNIDIEDPSQAALLDSTRVSPSVIDITAFDDAELESICDNRLLLAETYRRRKVDIVVQPCPQSGSATQPRMGYLLDKLLKRDRARLVAHLKDLTSRLSLADAAPVHPQMYVFGHTHTATPPNHTRIGVGWYAYVANTGAFQRLADGAWLKQIIADRKLDEAHVLTSVSIADLRPCYSFVTVKAGASADTLKQRAWMQANDHWQETESCK